MRQPKSLMIHTCNHYAATFTKEAGARVASYPTHPTNEDLPCNWQSPTSEVIEIYLQREEKLKASCFLVSKTIFDGINVKDRIEFDGINYRVMGKADLCSRGRVFRIDVSEEVS